MFAHEVLKPADHCSPFRQPIYTMQLPTRASKGSSGRAVLAEEAGVGSW